MLKDRLVVLTEEEYEAMEARKPQVSAGVIAEARRWAQNLRLWPNTATPTEDGFRLITGDGLRACSAAFDALLAAVEAAPDEERLTVPPAKHRFAEWCGENFAAIWYEFSLLRDELGLPQPECDEEASGSAPAPEGERLTEEHSRALRDALAGYQCYPEWQNAADHLAQTVSDVLCAVVPGYAEGCLPPAPKPPAPDFSAMDPDNLSLEEVQALRDWLDERGRRKVREEFRDGGGVAWRGELWVRDKPGHLLAQVHLQRTEPAALLALCQAVAAEEASC